MQPIIMKQGDRLPSLAVTAITTSGAAYDLTGGSVVFNMRSTTDGTVKISRSAAVLVSGPNGQVRYDWASGDLDTVGSYEAEFEVTLSGSRKLSIPSAGFIPIRVLDDIA